MKDSYDFSKLKNVKRNPFAEHLNNNGHSTIIHYSPKDIEVASCDEDLDYEEQLLINEYYKKSKM